jgi:hypothetical protein
MVTSSPWKVICLTLEASIFSADWAVTLRPPSSKKLIINSFFINSNNYFILAAKLQQINQLKRKKVKNNRANVFSSITYFVPLQP